MSEEQRLRAEVTRLRGEVARLERRVSELDALAFADPLVPLPNRRGLVRSLEKAIARLARYGEECALLFVDVNGLKEINDRHGHGAGDHALLHVAEAMLKGTRRGDTVARVGGDEFCILLERAAEDRAREIAQRLVESVAADPIVEDGQRIDLSVSIGVATLQKGDRPADALARADEAMYASKRAA